MEVTKLKWFTLEIHEIYLDEFKESCEELDINYEIGNTDSSNNIEVKVEVKFAEEMFYLGQWYEAKK